MDRAAESAGATTGELASGAGVRQPLLAYHVRSKEGLWHAVVDALFDRSHRTVDERTAGLQGVDHVTTAKPLVHGFITFSAPNAERHRIITQEPKADGPRMDYLLDRPGRYPRGYPECAFS